MVVIFHKSFYKDYGKLPNKIQDKFWNRLEIFKKDRNDKILNNHSVDKVFPDCRSINVTGDYRAVFKEENGVVHFVNIGTHSELY